MGSEIVLRSQGRRSSWNFLGAYACGVLLWLDHTKGWAQRFSPYLAGENTETQTVPDILQVLTDRTWKNQDTNPEESSIAPGTYERIDKFYL